MSLSNSPADDMDSLLEGNDYLFTKKFESQTAEIVQAMDRSATAVIKALSKGVYQRLEDPDLRTLWREEVQSELPIDARGTSDF